jgi:hypothetical protein
MRPSVRSSGVATVAAITSGLAPGRLACTLMVGKSTWGRGDTGSSRNAIAPSKTTATASSVVPIGRLMKIAEKFTPAFLVRSPRG